MSSVQTPPVLPNGPAQLPVVEPVPVPPSAPPVPLGYYAGPGPSVSGSVRELGLAQRRLCRVLLLAIAVAIASGVMGGVIGPVNPQFGVVVVGLVMLARMLTIALMMVSIEKMARALGAGTGARVFYCIAMIIPFVGIIVLLVVNNNATAALQLARIRVGFMGPRLADLPVA